MPFDSTNYQPNDEVLDVLVKARANIADPSRWMKLGPAHTSGMRGNCIVGHTGRLCDTSALAQAVALALAAHLPDERSRRFASAVWVFNDHPATTHADVLALFDRAIAGRVAEQAKATA